MESWRSNKSHKQRNGITPLQKTNAIRNNQNDESSSGDLKKKIKMILKCITFLVVGKILNLPNHQEPHLNFQTSSRNFLARN
jgi:hypothetical protein